MMKYTLTNTLLLVILLVGSGQARSFPASSGQQPRRYLSPSDYDYTFGDPAYDYEGSIARNGRGDHSIIYKETSKDSGSEKVFPVKRGVPTHEDRVPQVVLDDSYNYDYTYGDPSVDYGDIQLPGGDDGRDSADEVHIGGGAPDDDHSDGDARKNENPIITSIIEWMIRSLDDMRFLRDKWTETSDHVKMSLDRVEHSMERIHNALGKVMKKFGREAEKGLRYCLVKFNATSHKISEQSLQAIDKLENLLEEGDEVVAALFQLIGHKVEEIMNRHNGSIIDLSIGQGPLFDRELGLANYLAPGAYGEDTHDHRPPVVIPNLFEDEQVLQNLNQMVEANKLERDEVEALLTAAAKQTQRATGKNYPRRIKLA